MRVSRTCTEVREKNDGQSQGAGSRFLGDEKIRSLPAYVLLGDPGSGKSTAFEMECKALGEEAYHHPVSADEFLEYDNDFPAKWRGKTLFIDGLDEVRAGCQDVGAQFREIRKGLRALGAPRFRLSCRHADWRGSIDQDKLRTVTQDSGLVILQLDPLTTCDVEKILKARSGILPPREFIKTAQDKGVDGFLTNPQTLTMLIKVVGAGGKWPASRKELFEEACGKMVREHNKEHQDAHDSNNPLSSEQLLNAAGRLCAVQLISGAYGYMRRGELDEKYPALDQCDYDLAALRSALATKLFKGVFNNRFVPIHRHIAEFLAGRYLADVIKEGVPARRIIALITGKDGMVVTEMRGLSAWLAAYSEDARAYLIEQDPVGVGLYGDIGRFSTDEKRSLLYSLKGEKSRLDYPGWRQATAFRALAAPDIEPALKDVLTDSDRGEEHQLVADLVLRVLQDGKSLPGLSGILLEIIRDDRNPWWPIIRKLALDAFIQKCPDSEGKTSKLKALLADIQGGSVSDPDNELLGTLLIELYPQKLSPSEVWEYFSETGDPPINGRYNRFWQIHLIDRDISSEEQVTELLDGLSGRLAEWRLSLELRNRKLYDLPITLLSRGLQAHGDRIDAKRLYDWLDVGLAGDGGLGRSGQEVLSGIRVWLEKRPDVQKAIIMEGLERCSASDSEFGFDICASGVEKRLYGASIPSDYGLWCLEQAVAIADSKPRIAVRLLEIAAGTHESQNGNEGVSLDLLIERAGSVKVLEERLNQILASQSIQSSFSEHRKKNKEYAEEQRRREEEWVAYVRSNEVALRENRAIPYLLHQIARAYFGAFADSSGCNGPKAVAQWLNGDQNLTDAALQGLRGVMERGDVSEIEEVLGLYEQSPLPYLVWPFLAGLVEVERTAPGDDASQWGDDRIRKAVMFWYCASYSNDLPQWYERLLLARPEIVAEIQVQFAISVFRNGSPVHELYALVHRPSHAQVAKYASLPLLQAFPVRCTLKQIESLDYLLWAAIHHADRTSLQKLIERERSLKSMNVAQRVRWLAAGVIVSPETFSDILEDFVQGKGRRIRSLWKFISSGAGEQFIDFGDEAQFAFRNLDISVWGLLIRLLGSCFAGGRDFAQWWDAPRGARTITTEEMASDFVGGLIKRLAKSPSGEASDALVNLVANPALERWRDTLKQAQDNQRTNRRDAGYRHPDIEQVCKTLDGGTPSNPADLAALLVDRLDEIGSKIRRGPTSDWRQYWNVDSYNRPLRKEPEDAENSHDPPPCQEPEEAEHSHDSLPCQRPEDACRDHLLSDLQEKLSPWGIDAQPEGQYANDKRSDIRVFYAGFNVPVEIKKNSHLELWSAIRDQLIAKYASDHKADGYGIYLVFWFGTEYTKTPHDERGYPDNADEMEQWLKDSLSPEQARKISVCVIDVSIPEGKSAGK